MTVSSAQRNKLVLKENLGIQRPAGFVDLGISIQLFR